MEHLYGEGRVRDLRCWEGVRQTGPMDGPASGLSSEGPRGGAEVDCEGARHRQDPSLVGWEPSEGTARRQLGRGNRLRGRTGRRLPPRSRSQATAMLEEGHRGAGDVANFSSIDRAALSEDTLRLALTKRQALDRGHAGLARQHSARTICLIDKSNS
jgi:hypothetical protein